LSSPKCFARNSREATLFRIPDRALTVAAQDFAGTYCWFFAQNPTIGSREIPSGPRLDTQYGLICFHCPHCLEARQAPRSKTGISSARQPSAQYEHHRRSGAVSDQEITPERRCSLRHHRVTAMLPISSTIE